MPLPENKIQVFTRCPITRIILEKPIEVETLCFWYQDQVTHKVNSSTLNQFLKNLALYGAYVHRNCPDKGCFSLNADHQFTADQVIVAQIYYQGQLIYSK